MKGLVRILGLAAALASTAVWYGVRHRAKDWEAAEAAEEAGGKAPNSWFLAQRSFPGARFEHSAWVAGLEQARRSRARGYGSDQRWSLVGPDNIGGRITDLHGSPANPRTVYAGTASGGVFRSRDAGATWAPIFDEAPSLSIGAVAVDPQDPATIWVGTGEANSSGTTYPGSGIYVTHDEGRSWEHKGLEATQHIGRVVVDPGDSRSIYVAALGALYAGSAERGVYHSKDGGETWQLLLHPSATAGAVDLVLDPANPQVILAAFWDRLHQPDKLVAGGPGSGVYKSSDGGASWRRLGQGLPAAAATGGRIGLSLCAADPRVVYAIFDDTAKNFNGVYRSDDTGETWRRTSDGDLSGMYATYGWWFGNIRVDPTNPDRVFALGYSAHMSSDGGRTWSALGGVHADNHALFLNPAAPATVYLGNDGGVFTSVDHGGHFARGGNIAVTEFYSVAVDATHSERLFGGAQDNGTVRTRTGGASDWKEVNGGDGFQVIVDPVDGKVVYSESQYGALGRSDDGGANFSDVAPGAARANWNTPIRLDPNDHKALFYGGEKLYRSANQGDTWTAISPDLSGGAGEKDALVTGTITAFDVAKADSKVIYAGTDNGKLWVTRDAGRTWTPIGAALPRRWITGLATDPADAGRVVLTISGYRSGERLPHVFRSTDFGAQWTDIAAGLPEVPVNVVRLDPESATTLYVGTDAGAYVSRDDGASWRLLGAGLPMVPVIDLTYDGAGRRLLAATFGRSIYGIRL